ncbi:MAG: nucleotidyltransferase domain-containing protein [Candidatus Stygibacter australis]|nr:nucleotidyltransferase domain-containing protein [Candidatus Stygibacter australis]MDP8322395.1 nucleotidyltransferase domain-containing protein [Candidatus Stygibacter australis]
MNEFNTKIRAEIKQLLEADEKVITAWEGGSLATGYFDEYSDLDLAVISEDDAIDEIFAKVETYLKDNYGIKHKFRIPEPNWHGHSQCFYIIDNCPEMFYVDFLIEKESAGNRFLESDRHGNAIVWFDKKDYIDGTPTPEDIIKKKCQDQLKMVKTYLPFTFKDVQKQIYRNNKIDAFALYISLVSRIVSLMNIKYRPAKHDFGMRYLHRDFPIEKQQLIEKLLYVKTLEELQANLLQIIEIYAQLVSDLQEYE